MRRTKQLKSNLSARKRKAVKDLNYNSIILQADKENTTVVIYITSYCDKIVRLLEPEDYIENAIEIKQPLFCSKQTH